MTLRRTIALTPLLAALSCGDGDDETAAMTSATTAGLTSASAGTASTTTSSGSTDGSSATTTTTGASASSTSGATDPTTADPTATDPTTSTSTGTTDPTTGDPTEDTTTGFEPQPFMFSDPLIDGTLGAAIGGAFGPEGWTVTGVADRIYWEIPSLGEGSVEFTVAGITLDNLPLNDHEIFAMYEGGYDIEHPIDYNPEFRNNAFKSMIRIYGVAEGDRVGKQKIMWGICPFGPPGYHGGECPCVDPPGFFDEPFGGDPNWDGSPQRLRVEWGPDRVTRYLRNDVEVLSIDWSSAGLTFGPESLYVSLGNPRPLEVDTAGMPIGAVFSDLVIEGWTGPPSQLCGL
ncbi:MAG: hypothetical protein R3B09_12455 [Nannocystaceae bacterium]